MPKRPVSATHGAMTDMPTGLIRRGGAYSLRRRIPLDLIDAYGGRKETVRALGTNDLAEAKIRLARKQVELNDEFAAHRRDRDADPAAPIKRSLAELRPHLAKPGDGTSYSDAEVDRQIEEGERSFREQFEAEEERHGRELSRQRLLAVANVPNDLLTDEQLALKDVLEDAKWEVELAKAELANRPVGAKARPIKTGAVDAGLSVAVGTSWEALVSAWARDRNPAKRTITAHGAVARWFADRTKVATAEEATSLHVRLFRTLLIEEGQTPANIKTKLSRLRTLLGYALEEGLIPTNPAALIRPPADKRPGAPRVSWTATDLNALFAGPVHSSGERPTQGRGEAAYWLPLLALFTGARLEELAQLRIRDVIEVPLEGGDHADELNAWALDINVGPEGKNNLKNKRAIRQIPIHPSLLDLGFLDYVRTLDEPLSLLFPDLSPSGEGRLGAKWGEWFSTYRKSLGICGSTKVFHSLRHTFKDGCRASKIPDRIQRQLMGHAPIDVADSYGVGFNFSDMVAALATYRIARLDLPKAPGMSDAASHRPAATSLRTRAR